MQGKQTGQLYFTCKRKALGCVFSQQHSTRSLSNTLRTMKFKARESNAEELQLNMTAMIDIVFQLLVFFIMTFKVTAMEADFNIRMPSVSSEPSIFKIEPVVIEVALKADSDRRLSRIDVEVINSGQGSSYSGKNQYTQLTTFVENVITQESDPSQGGVEVEFDIDESLRYAYTVKAIEAVFGKIEDGKVSKLVENIKFRPKQ